METLDTLTGRIARRDPARAEAMLQADIIDVGHLSIGDVQSRGQDE